MSRTTFDNLYAAIVGSGITFCAARLVATGDYETSAGVAVCCAGGGAAWVLWRVVIAVLRHVCLVARVRERRWV